MVTGNGLLLQTLPVFVKGKLLLKRGVVQLYFEFK